MKIKTTIIITHILLFFAYNLSAEELFDVLKDDGTSPTKSYAMVDTITEKPRIIEVDRSGKIIWEAKIPPPESLRQICRGADIEYLAERDVFRFLTPLKSISEVNRGGDVKTLVIDDGVSHDFDSLADGSILYARGWANKGEIEFVEINKSGKRVFSWNGNEEIASSLWDENAKYGKWPKNWNTRLRVSRKGKDWLHVNSVAKLKDGGYMISSPNINSILILSESGKLIELISDTNIVHDPKFFQDGIIFSEKVPNLERTDFIERIVILDGSGKKVFLMEGRLRAIRGISLLEDDWFSITSSGQIIEINKNGKIRYHLKIKQQNSAHEENSSRYRAPKTFCGPSMGTLYKAVPIS